MGSNNTLPVTVQSRNGTATVLLDGHTLHGAPRGPSADRQATAAIRVEDVRLVDGPGRNVLPATHEMSGYLGASIWADNTSTCPAWATTKSKRWAARCNRGSTICTRSPSAFGCSKTTLRSEAHLKITRLE